MTLYIKTDVAPRMTLCGASILALIALNFTFLVLYLAVGSDNLVQDMISIGFGIQLLLICLTVTHLNSQVAHRLPSKAVEVELIGFLRWTLPVGLFSLIVTRSMLTAFI